MLVKAPYQKLYTKLHFTLVFIAGGAIGNLIDRLRYDFLVCKIDFIDSSYNFLFGNCRVDHCLSYLFQKDDCKKIVVEKDPTEKGERAILNFGHTIGHAIEKAKNFELLVLVKIHACLAADTAVDLR